MGDFLTSLVQNSIAMSIVALALMALTPILSKRYQAGWIYGTWLVIVAGFLIPFRFPIPVEIGKAERISIPIQKAFLQNAGGITAFTARSATAGEERFSAFPWAAVLFAIWLSGAVLFLLAHALQHIRFLKMIRRWGEPVDSPETLSLLEKARQDLNISTHVNLALCPFISSPMMTGFKNPMILLPSPDYSAEALPCLFRHELVHYKRKDLWFKSLVILATAIHWFNPIVYLMGKAIALQCEISCDAEAVSGTGIESRKKYGETILKAIRRKPLARTAFSTNFYSGRVGMKKRILSVLDTRKKKTGVLILCVILIGTAGTGTVFAADRHEEQKPVVSQPEVSQQSTESPVQKAAEKWAEAVKKRDGKAQYALMTPKCQSAVLEQFKSMGWSTGVSSPWVDSYAVTAAQNSAKVIYQYATSTGFAGDYEQSLTFVKKDGKYLIDSFSEPERISQAESQISTVSEPQNFLESEDGQNFQKTANRFVKAYLIGDIREMKRNLSDPEDKQNDFSMDGKSVHWKSLSLKVDSQNIENGSVTAEYQITLTDGKSQKLSFHAVKSKNNWKVKTYQILE